MTATTDSTNPVVATTDPANAAVVADAITARLTALGVTPDIIAKIKDELGATTEEDLQGLTEPMLTSIGMKPLKIAALLKAIAPPAPVATTTTNVAVDPTAELGENEAPTHAQVNSFAGMVGADPMMLMMLMNGGGGDADLSGMIPINNMVAGYNPKRRDMYLMIMGQVEKRLGVPIVVIDGDGSINKPLTVEYIEGLEEGRDAAENNIHFDADGIPHEVIRVGVDAQSIYDADPLEPTKALQKSGMGVGRVNWNGVSLEVKQVAFFAVTRTKEIDPTSDAHQAWLRDHMKKGVNRLVFHGQAPRAIGEYNEAARTGSLPTLRVMLSRGPRRQELFPRRRSGTPRDLTPIGGRGGRDDL